MSAFVWLSCLVVMTCHSAQLVQQGQSTQQCGKYSAQLKSKLEEALGARIPTVLVHMIYAYSLPRPGLLLPYVNPYCVNYTRYVGEQPTYTIVRLNTGGLPVVRKCYFTEKRNAGKASAEDHSERVEEDLRTKCSVPPTLVFIDTTDCWSTEEIVQGIMQPTVHLMACLMRCNMKVVPYDSPEATSVGVASAIYLDGDDFPDYAPFGACMHTVVGRLQEAAKALPGGKFVIGSGSCDSICSMNAILQEYPHHQENIQNLIAGGGSLVPIFWDKRIPLEGGIGDTSERELLAIDDCTGGM